MDYKTLIHNRKAMIKYTIDLMFEKIENNKDILNMDYVYEDLRKLELEIARTIQRMGLLK